MGDRITSVSLRVEESGLVVELFPGEGGPTDIADPDEVEALASDLLRALQAMRSDPGGEGRWVPHG